MKITDAKVFVCCPGRNFVTLEGNYSAVLFLGLINTAIDRGETRPLWVANGFNRFSSPGRETVQTVHGLVKSAATALKC